MLVPRDFVVGGLRVAALVLIALFAGCGSEEDPLMEAQCGSPLALCSGTCVDVTQNVTNCGACGVACGTTQGCAAGACVCPGGYAACGASCVNTAVDVLNCGQCGVVCTTGQTCGGTAGCQCQAGLVACGEVCTDVTSDPLNCGSCGTTCLAGQFCAAGACVATCPATTTACGGSCVDVTTSTFHCGACNAACAAGQTCSGGTCGCPPDPTNPLVALTACSGACVNTLSDLNNCGACGQACAGGQQCTNGVCACANGGTACPSGCVNTMGSDSANCGACGAVCAGTCTNGVCSTGTGGAGTGGAGTGGVATGGLGTGGVATGGTGTGGTGNTSTGGSTSLLGGYHVHGDWAGFAFAFASGGATLTAPNPANFENMVDQDGPYCVRGTVLGTANYSSIAAVGVNASQPKIDDAPVNTIATTGSGLLVNITVNSGVNRIRVQLEDGTDPADPDAANHRWCVNLTGSQNTVIPWDSFETTCWDTDTGTPFNPATPIAKVIVYVPDAGTAGGSQNFDFCLNDIGPDNVTGRGTGEIVASCANSVSWAKTSTNQQYENIATSDNRYQFQSNGWGWTGGSHSISLLPACGFRMDTQTCSRSDSTPCSFPSLYIGTDADGTRTTGNGLPRQVSAISSIPTCLGWSSGTSGANDEYNVSYDVWFNSNSGANYADTFLMVWLRDPPSFQPAGNFPVANGVVIGGQTWAVWHGPNASNQQVTSYTAPNPRANGQAYSFDLKDFIDDAVARGYLSQSTYLISVMGGLEIWGGGQGASVTQFKAQVQ